MPGASLLWNESAPADTDNAGQGDDEIRSLKTSIRNGLAAEHVWPSNTGSGFGVHALGSARAFYDVESNVSSSGTDGRLFVASDTSRFFHAGSGGTMLLGGQNAILGGGQPTGGQGFYWASEFGAVFSSTTTTTIVFNNSGFSGVPIVTMSIVTSAAVGGIVGQITSVTATQFTVQGFIVNTGTNTSKFTIMYQSIGTRVL